MDFQRLLPDPAPAIDVDELLDSLALRERATAQRPYTIANFVESVDGRATVKGRSRGLGDDGDRALFHGLRERVDAVMVGTGTLRAEDYGRILGRAERRERRTELGLNDEPLAVVVSRSGAIPTGARLFGEPEARIVVFTCVDCDVSGCAAHVDLVQLDPSRMTLTTVMRVLRVDHDVRWLLCEGGPTLLSALLHERLLDELFVTLAAKLVGGGNGPTITIGAELIEPQELSLSWLLARPPALYARYAISPT
jgi:riboflavin-specific deaminase-like protein